jgi:hypothetical protein
MRLIAICSLALVPILTACVGSIQPVYTDKDLVYDANLLGDWQDSSSSATASITAAKSTAYAIAFTDEEGRAGAFSGHLARIGDMTLLDLEPLALPETLSETYRDHFVPLHSFFFVEQGRDRLRLTTVDPGHLRDFLQAQPNAVAHFEHDNDIVLTAGPRELQPFLATYRKHPGVLTDPIVWKRP